MIFRGGTEHFSGNGIVRLFIDRVTLTLSIDFSHLKVITKVFKGTLLRHLWITTASLISACLQRRALDLHLCGHIF